MNNYKTNVSSPAAETPHAHTAPLTIGVREIADLLGMSIPYVYKLIREKELPVFKIGSSYRIRPERLLAWVEEKEQAAG